MRYIIILLSFLVFSSKTNNTLATIINDNNKTFFVTSVRAEGASFETEQSTKQIALQQAKQTAFNDLLNYLNIENLYFDEINLNSTISSYKIVDEYYNDNFYSIIVNFEFDKDILKSVLRKTQNNSKNKIDYEDYVVVLKEKENIIQEYKKLATFLKKEKIVFYPIKIEQEKINILLKQVNEDKIYVSLKVMNLNGSIYKN